MTRLVIGSTMAIAGWHALLNVHGTHDELMRAFICFIIGVALIIDLGMEYA